MIQRSSGATLALTEKTVVTVRAIRTEADRTACEMPEARKCLTLPVAGLLAAYGPRLGMPAARQGEAPAAPVLLATSRTDGFPDAYGWSRQALPAGPIAGLLRGLVGGRPPARAMPPPVYVPAAERTVPEPHSVVPAPTVRP